jgi:hypothetical protein
MNYYMNEKLPGIPTPSVGVSGYALFKDLGL